MGKFEDLLEELRELDGGDDLAGRFEEFSGSKLRQRAERASELERENETLKANIAKRDAAPRIEQAFKNAGVNFEQLRPADREVIQSLDADQLTDDKVGELIARYELPLIEGQQQQAEDPPAAAVVDAARQAPTGIGNGAPKTAEITVEDYASWPHDKQVKFNLDHRDAAEALKRGETVTGIVFS